jgi:hypothetical protein
VASNGVIEAASDTAHANRKSVVAQSVGERATAPPTRAAIERRSGVGGRTLSVSSSSS